MSKSKGNSAVETISLRDQIHNNLRKMLIRNELAPSSRIIEAELSSQLGLVAHH